MNKQEIRKVLANIGGKYNVANSAQVWGPVSTLAEFFERNPSDSNDCLGSHRNGLIESFDHNSGYITHLLNAWETRSKIAGSTDYAQLNEIEASFNSIWGELESENLRRITLPPDTTTTIGSALSSFIESPRMQETGLWLAIDCFHELNQSSTNVLCQSESSVETLLLLYGDEAIGCVGKLVMDRFQQLACATSDLKQTTDSLPPPIEPLRNPEYLPAIVFDGEFNHPISIPSRHLRCTFRFSKIVRAKLHTYVRCGRQTAGSPMAIPRKISWSMAKDWILMQVSPLPWAKDRVKILCLE